jgi:hypothetical protein
MNVCHRTNTDSLRTHEDFSTTNHDIFFCLNECLLVVLASGRPRAALRFAHSMWGPVLPEQQEGEGRDASDLEGPGRGVKWMPCWH